jgi:hypothetical protein
MSTLWPALVEIETARPEDGDKLAASPIYRAAYAKDEFPSLGHETLLDMFE